MDISTLLIAMGVPSGVTAFCFWILERRISRREETTRKKQEQREKELDEKERLREQNLVLLLQSVNASIALGEATAKAVQRIPDAHCNGDMQKALEYATEVKHEQKEFLTKQGVHNIYYNE